MSGLRNPLVRFWRRAMRRPISALAVITLTVIWAPFGFSMTAASAAVDGGFEIDGNIAPSTNIDWGSSSSIVGTQPRAADPVNQAENSVYAQGSKETDSPLDWHVSSSAGQGGKDDIGYVYEFNHTADVGGATHEFAYVAFERASNNGTTHFDVEFNQQADVMNNDNTALVPNRQNNDVLVQITQLGSGSFDVSGTAFLWDASTSTWTPITPSPWIEGVSNTVSIDPVNNSDPLATDSGKIPAGQFAEVSIDLTGLLGINEGCPGEQFGAMNVRSWAANPKTQQPELKDYISPLSVHIPSNCADLIIKKYAADGTTLIGGATFTVTPNPTTGTGSLSVTDGGTNDPDGTANGIVEFSQAKPNINYSVEETSPPPGYIKGTTTTQTSGEISSFGSATVSFNNYLGSVSWQKVDADHPSVHLGGATFTITATGGAAAAAPWNLDSNPITVADNGARDTNKSNGYFTVGGLPTGDYTIHETVAPTGYNAAADQNFSIADSFVNRNVSLESAFADPEKRSSLVVEKTDDSIAHTPLAGAVFQLWEDTNGTQGLQTTGQNTDTLIGDCTTATNGQCTVGQDAQGHPQLLFGSYYWVEETAPQGYTINTTTAGPIVLDATHNGNPYGDPTVFQDSGVLSSWNVEKTNAQTGQPVAGAHFDLYREVGSSPDPSVDNRVVHDCVTDATGFCPAVTGLGFGTYYWVETQAPAGFELAPASDITGNLLVLSADNAGGDFAAAVFADPPTGSLAITKGATPAPNTSVQFGDTITYSLDVTATGTEQQTNVVATDFIPGYNPNDTTSGKTTYVAGSATCSTGCTASYSASAHELTWNVGTLDPGSTDAKSVTVHLTFQVTVDRPAAAADGSIPGEVIDNVGAVASDQTPSTPSNVVHHPVTAVLGIKIIRTPPVKAKKLPFTGSALPVGPASTVAIALLGAGTALVSLSRRRRYEGQHRLTD